MKATTTRRALALVASLGLVVAACGSDNAADSNTAGSGTASQTSQSSEKSSEMSSEEMSSEMSSSAESSADVAESETMSSDSGTAGSATGGASSASCDEPSQGVTDDTIKIGTTQPLSGSAATAGESFAAGIEAAVDQRNADGGINGRQLELTVLDDGFEAARSVANVRRLGDEEQVFAIVSPAGSANLPGSWEYIGQKGLPVFGPVLPPDPDLEEVYLIGTGHADQVRVIVDWLSDQGVKTVGLLRQDNDLGAAFKAGLEEQAPKHGIEVVAEETVEPNSTDISNQVLKIRDANPDAVISGADNIQTALLLDQAYDVGWKPIIIGNSSTAGPGAIGTVGSAAPEAAEGFYGSSILSFTTDDTPEVQAYRSAMEETGHGDLADNSFALQGYAHASILFDAMETLGDNLCWSALQTTLEGLSDYQTGLVAPVTFGPLPGGHTGTKGARIAQYTGGEWVFVTEFLEPQD